MTDDDDTTPLERPPRARSISSAVTSWGIVEAWLAGDGRRSATLRVDERRGLFVRVTLVDGVEAHELVQPNEDPSVTLVRAIGKLPAATTERLCSVCGAPMERDGALVSCRTCL